MLRKVRYLLSTLNDDWRNLTHPLDASTIVWSKELIISTATQPQTALNTSLEIRRASAAHFPNFAKAFKTVATQVREEGLLRRAQWFYALVGAAIAAGFAACIAISILIGPSWYLLIIAAVAGILFAQVGFLGHEAAHRVILSSGPRNDRLALVLINFIGMSYAWWDSKHTRHHANPNQVGKDPDIKVDTVSFLEEDAALARGIQRLITKYQGWLFFPLINFEGLNLHYHSFKHLLSPGKVKNRWLELALLTFRFAALYIPIFYFLPLGMAFAFSGVMLAVFGTYMGASFAPNHKGMPVVPREVRLDFFSKQVRTSRNITGGWWVTAFMGGLNYQVEHHLFPSMARPYLARTSKIVKAYCLENGIPYTQTTLIRSYRAVIDYLNEVGIFASDPFECPMVHQFRPVA